MTGTEQKAVIVGTSLMGLMKTEPFCQARRFQVATPHGTVAFLEVSGRILLQRHGLDDYDPPHRIDHLAHFAALKQAGVRSVVALGSVGSLRRHLPPGSVVVPDDFFAPNLNPTFFADARGHVLPRFDPVLRSVLLAALSRAGLPAPVDGAVYWQTTGPRFETAAEIRCHAPWAEIVGMTLASECILACELGLPYAAVAIVDNFANGIGGDPLTMDLFRSQVADNAPLAHGILETLLNLP
ncbi:MAG: MTAP family purine nucleoside phosphorylase [Magnetococcales bacterium]|nr:MTAP family purine nucleoside phosphorylase [Magnetococcales bacterium]